MSNTVELLKAMKFSGMANELTRQMEDSRTYEVLGFEERLGLLVDAEWGRRQINKLNRNIKAARLSISSATMEGIEYHSDRKLDKVATRRPGCGRGRSGSGRRRNRGSGCCRDCR